MIGGRLVVLMIVIAVRWERRRVEEEAVEQKKEKWGEGGVFILV